MRGSKKCKKHREKYKKKRKNTQEGNNERKRNQNKHPVRLGREGAAEYQLKHLQVLAIWGQRKIRCGCLRWASTTQQVYLLFTSIHLWSSWWTATWLERLPQEWLRQCRIRSNSAKGLCVQECINHNHTTVLYFEGFMAWLVQYLETKMIHGSNNNDWNIEACV